MQIVLIFILDEVEKNEFLNIVIISVSFIEAEECRIPQNFLFLKEFVHLIHPQQTLKLKADLPVL